MTVTSEVKARVAAKVKQGLHLARDQYSRQFSMPTILYTKRGTTAGTANSDRWEINLNADLLMQNVDAFLERTVPHELAHLITDKMYPEKIVVTRGKRVKRDIHGDNWRSVCKVLGMSDVTRCHSYDVSNARVVKSNGRQDKWVCGCGKQFLLTPKRSAILDAKPTALWHAGCKGRHLLTRVNPTAQVAQVAPTGQSKIEICKAIYKRSRHLDRSAIIALFVDGARCTPAGAATYYASCKKLPT